MHDNDLVAIMGALLKQNKGNGLGVGALYKDYTNSFLSPLQPRHSKLPKRPRRKYIAPQF